MAVYIYQPGEHAGGFVGVRVARWIGGVQHSRHFSFRRADGRLCSLREQRRLRREAEALDVQWLAKKEALRMAERPWATGIKGISATFAVEKRQRNGAIHVYYAPMFKVQGSTQKRRYQKAFRITKLGYDKAWNEAVEYYARNKGFRQWASLRRLRPDPKQFRRIRRAMNARGHSIPTARLPNGE